MALASSPSARHHRLLADSEFIFVKSWENEVSGNVTQWGQYSHGGIVLDVMIPPLEPVESFEIRVRKAWGLGVAVTHSPIEVTALLHKNSWYAIDEWVEQWLHHLTPPDRGWEKYFQHRAAIESVWRDVH